MDKVISITQLSKYYGKSRGIIDVSFDVEKGEIFGFIGPNGAGKSTTIRLLLALIRPTSGHAEVFGKDCGLYAPEIAENVGYLPGEVFYYEDMRVKDLLNYSARFYKKDCSDNIKRLSERLDLDLNRKIEDLSLGNKKKVGIVQGLLHAPELIILDEPTTGLDPLMQNTFFDLIREENERGATVLMSSHILSEVQRLCQRIAIIKEGRIVQVEKMATLRKLSHLRVALSFNGDKMPELDDVEGVENLKLEGGHCTFLYRGDVNRVVQILSEIELTDLTIEEPDLEDIFLHYYEKEKSDD